MTSKIFAEIPRFLLFHISRYSMFAGGPPKSLLLKRRENQFKCDCKKTIEIISELNNLLHLPVNLPSVAAG
jgi:hypothetical protein